MPYIVKSQRVQFDDYIEQLKVRISGTEDLNYCITKLVHEYLKTLRKINGELSYSDFNSALGVLSCAEQELYRKVIAPYEDKKRQVTGNISKLDEINLEEIR